MGVLGVNHIARRSPDPGDVYRRLTGGTALDAVRDDQAVSWQE